MSPRRDAGRPEPLERLGVLSLQARRRARSPTRPPYSIALRGDGLSGKDAAMKTTKTVLAVLFATVILSACNTVAGAARDTYGAGRFVANQAFGDD